MLVYLPEERKSSIEEINEEDKFQKCTPVRVLAKLIGKLSATLTQQNTRINPKKEMQKLLQEEKDLAILSEKGKLYCPTDLKNTKWSYTDQIGLKLNQQLQKECQIAQQKWSNFMKKQTSNPKEITPIYLAFHHFLPLIKKSRYKNVLIRTDNTAAMYNINKKSGAKNLYHTSRKIWKLSEKNSLTLKAIHIPGRINVTTDRLNRLEMSGDYHLNDKVFQRIQRMWGCYPRIDLFTSKKNRLIKTYA
jgi:hypothetical protein